MSKRTGHGLLGLAPAVFLGLAMSLQASAALADLDAPLKAAGWDEITFPGKTANHFTRRDDGAIEIASEGSVSLLQKPVTIDISGEPILHWRWCVTRPAPATDLAIRGEDDRSLALYVAFPFVAETASGFEKIERKIVEKSAGPDAPGRVLMYVWGGRGERGAPVPSPHMGTSGRMTILRPASTPPGAWFEENINIAEDYRNAFGSEPPNPMSIAISADTDDTSSQSRGLIIDLDFLGEQRVF